MAQSILLTMSSELGLDTDDVREAICFLAGEGEIELWPLDEDLSADDIDVIRSGPGWMELRCISSTEGTINMKLEIRIDQVLVVDEWHDTGSGSSTTEW